MNENKLAADSAIMFTRGGLAVIHAATPEQEESPRVSSYYLSNYDCDKY